MYYFANPAAGVYNELQAGGATWDSYAVAGGHIAAETFTTGGTPTTYYFVQDQLGSTTVMTNTSGTLTEYDSYDAWGYRRAADGQGNVTECGAIHPLHVSLRGYTAQEEMDNLCLVNLNARLYDPALGRALSADPTVPGAMNGQAFNRNAYVTNGPLSYTDPTGYCNTKDNSASCGPHVLPVDPGDIDTSIPASDFTLPGPAWTNDPFYANSPDWGTGTTLGQNLDGEIAGGEMLGMATGTSNPATDFGGEGGAATQFFGIGSCECVVSTNISYNTDSQGNVIGNTMWGTFSVTSLTPEGGWYDPTSTFVGGVGVLSDVGKYSAGASTLGINLRNIFKSQIYLNGWGGNQYVWATGIADAAESLGRVSLGVGVALDAYGAWSGIISPTELSIDLMVDAIGAFGGLPGAAIAGTYYGLQTFYPGGAAGAFNEYSNLIEESQAIDSSLVPFEFGRISFRPGKNPGLFSSSAHKKKKRDRETIGPYDLPADSIKL